MATLTDDSGHKWQLEELFDHESQRTVYVLVDSEENYQ